MSYTAREFSHSAKLLKLLKSDYCCCCKSTVGKHYISLFEEKYPWNKVLSKPFRITETSTCRRRGHLCRFHKKHLSIVLLARWHSHCILYGGMNAEAPKIHSPKADRKRQRFHLHLPFHFSSFFVCKAKILVSQTLSTRHFYC